ncbi:hypothetical protein EDB86DRAFT_3173085 [Lactarius hatsudake]|nr:hypothetical protein EDB86DRAFT_3173085 [Lactarius hatsudake]
MTHILGLNEQDQQTVINNLLLMGMGGLTPSIDTPQINAIGLYPAPSHDTPSRVNAMQLDLAPGTAIPTPVPSPFHADLASLSLTEPPPRPPRSPRRPHSPRIPPPPLPIVVEDDNQSGRGVKTSFSNPVFALPKPVDEPPRIITPTTLCSLALPASALNESPPQRPPCSPLREYRPIFLPNAFERPREPDEIIPQTPRPLPAPRPVTQHRRANAADTSSQQQLANSETTRPPVHPVVTHDHDRQNRNARRSRQNQDNSNNDIRAWLGQIVHDPPPRSRPRARPSLRVIPEETVDPERREYRYDYDYTDACRED